MKKEKFLELFPRDAQNEARKLYNYFETAEKYEINIFTEEFYTPNFWKKLGGKIDGITVKTQGLTDISERRQILFENYEDSLVKFPGKILKIKNLSKFKKQEHKDYLGSILGLNIKRELLGDILVYEEGAYVAVSEKISDYLLNNLIQIGRTPCEVSVVENMNEVPETEFSEIIIKVNSERLDSVVSELVNISRNSASEAVESGNIMLNYVIQKRKDKNLNISDIITIRQHGKFIFADDLGMTKKGKKKLLFKKYI
jgi:RNA-binding protein YlmH